MATVFIDTNVVLRYLLGDIKSQYKQAENILKQAEKNEIKVFISILVIDELIWALNRYYQIPKKSFIPALLNILSIKNIQIFEAKKDLIINLLQSMVTREIDFTDLYLSKIATKEQLFSFDKDFKKLFN